MIEDQFTPEEQNLIQQLRTTPRPKLNASSREAIRQQVVNELRITAASLQQPSVTHRIVSRPVYRAAAALFAAAVIVAVGLVFIQSRSQQPATVSMATTAPTDSTQVAIVPSVTPTSAIEGITPTVTESTTTPTTTEVVPGVTPTPQPTPERTPTVLPTATPALEAVVVVEGPLVAIVNNIITIYDFDIAVEPQHPILNLIDVGDFVRAEGVLSSTGVMVASVVSNLTSAPVVSTGAVATVGLDGPVEAIDGNTVMVNGIAVRFDPADPVLRTLRVGDFVSVQGNFVGSGPTVVLVVVNVAVIDNVTIIESGCWYHDTGMGMGHWHCDGMGMGTSMGMGTDMGMGTSMGMGEP